MDDTPGGHREGGSAALEASSRRTAIRVLLAIGNPERERRLRDALSGDGMVVADRCLDAVSLVERAGAMDLDVALVSSDLHRLTAASLAAMREARLALVLLVEPADIERYSGLAHLVPAGAGTEEVCTALREAMARGSAYPRATVTDDSERKPNGGEGDDDEGRDGQVIVVVSGKGAPGKTTLAIGLAAAQRSGDAEWCWWMRTSGAATWAPTWTWTRGWGLSGSPSAGTGPQKAAGSRMSSRKGRDSRY